jgi:hypothetical protein
MKNYGFVFILIGLLFIGLTGCSDSDSDSSKSDLRVIHGSFDAPNVNVYVDDNAVLEDVPYQVGSGFLQVATGTRTVRVDGILPGGEDTVIGPVNLDFMENEQTTVIALNEVANIEPLVIVNPMESVPEGQVRVQVAHAAVGVPTVDVYVTAPDAPLETPLGTFDFKGLLGPVEVPSATYQIRITPAGNPGIVVFDSGPVLLSEGGNLLIAALNNTGPGMAPVSLLVDDGGGSFEILDVDTPAAVRVIHNSPDAPPVDIIVNDDFAAPLVEGLPFPEFTTYLEVPADTYNLKVTPENDSETVVLDFDATVDPSGEYSVLAINFLAEIEEWILLDDNRSIATEVKVRIVHGSPSAGNVDIYVTPEGADIADYDPSFTNVPFRAQTGYVSLLDGIYDVTVVPTGTLTPAIGPLTLDLKKGEVYTVIARDAAGGGGPLGVILIDDLAD